MKPKGTISKQMLKMVLKLTFKLLKTTVLPNFVN